MSASGRLSPRQEAELTQQRGTSPYRMMQSPAPAIPSGRLSPRQEAEIKGAFQSSASPYMTQHPASMSGGGGNQDMLFVVREGPSTTIYFIKSHKFAPSDYQQVVSFLKGKSTVSLYRDSTGLYDELSQQVPTALRSALQGGVGTTNPSSIGSMQAGTAYIPVTILPRGNGAGSFPPTTSQFSPSSASSFAAPASSFSPSSASYSSPMSLGGGSPAFTSARPSSPTPRTTSGILRNGNSPRSSPRGNRSVYFPATFPTS